MEYYFFTSQVCEFFLIATPLTGSLLCPPLFCLAPWRLWGSSEDHFITRFSCPQTFVAFGQWEEPGDQSKGRERSLSISFSFFSVKKAVVLAVTGFFYPKPDLLLGQPSAHSPNPRNTVLSSRLKSSHDNSFPLLASATSPSLWISSFTLFANTSNKPSSYLNKLSKKPIPSLSPLQSNTVNMLSKSTEILKDTIG